ncbi:type VI secretion system tube protein Hcp [Pantoea agglomerans]|uniref:type VI secretion system tube protein Hcp n=1 Tax=Enterobacter agglomerans TaxID=549 RepID=UPI001F5B29DA|nr:type VI secretion system tube protein Hcp [Pantoea agglomerans]MCX2192215.1 type VI secretion system tube protein Hcp [Pantoea agglomerans]
MKKYVSSGNHISKVELSTCKAGGSQTEYCRITLEDVIVTNVLFNGAIHSEILSLSYQFQASKVKIQSWTQAL